MKLKFHIYKLNSYRGYIAPAPLLTQPADPAAEEILHKVQLNLKLKNFVSREKPFLLFPFFSLQTKVHQFMYFTCTQTILVGDSGVGKTSLLVQFDTGTFHPSSFAATVGIGFTVSPYLMFSFLNSILLKSLQKGARKIFVYLLILRFANKPVLYTIHAASPKKGNQKRMGFFSFKIIYYKMEI